MKRLLFIALLVVFGCEDKQEKDCAGVEGGVALSDSCGVCVGGNTGKIACTQDCADVWDGTAYLDDCGICSGGTTNHIANSDMETTYIEECEYQEVCNWQSIATGYSYCSYNSCHPYQLCSWNGECNSSGSGFSGMGCDNYSYCLPEYEEQYICSYENVCIDVPVTNCP